MANVRESNPKADGRTWSVLFRQGKRQTSITFPTAKRAGEVKARMDALCVDAALKALNHGD